MLDIELKSQLAAYLENLRVPLELIAYLDDGEVSRATRGLLQDIVEAGAGKITLRDANSNQGARVPSFRITRQGEGVGVMFAGLPLGHEFTSLVLALLHVGGHPPKLSDASIAHVKALEGDYHFETFFSQSCQNCPDVVQALNTMAALNPRIHHVAIDGASFPEEVEARKILTVPQVFLNGEAYAQGRMGVEEFLAKLDSGVAHNTAVQLSEKDPFDVLVIGGGPAGAAAAIYAARKGIRTGLVAERLGGQVLDTVAIENFISVAHTEGPKLAAALEAHVRDYAVDIMPLQRAERLTQAEGGYAITLASGVTLRSKTIVLATGARWRQMNVPGEANYLTRGVTFCPHCDGPLFKGKKVAVIGGGNSGIEAAIDLAGVVEHVTVLEFDDKLRADAVLQAKLNSLPNVTVLLSAMTNEVIGDGSKVTGLTYQDRHTKQIHTLTLGGIFVQIGLLPNTDWLKGTLELTPRGEIAIDARGETSLPGVFAAGDATTVPYKQIVVAMGAGSSAALSAFDYLIRAPVTRTAHAWAA